MTESPTTKTAMAALATALGGYALVGGFVSFLGWPLDLQSLTDWFNDDVSIQPNACLLIMLSGTGLLLVQWRAWRAVTALGGLVGIGGALILLQYVVGANFGFNHQLLFGRTWGQGTTLTPGRVGPPASTSFILSGMALVLLARTSVGPRRAHQRRFVPIIGVAVCVIMAFSLFGYLFGAEQFYTIPWLTAIALQTATMLLAVGLGLILSVPEHQPMLLLREQSGAGALARIAIPALVVMIPLVLRLRIWGFEQGHYDLGTGRALSALTLVVGMVGILWIALMAVRRHEQALRDSEARLRSIVEELEKLMDVMPVAVWIARDAVCREITGNRAGYTLLRVPPGNNLSKSASSGERPPGFRVLRNGQEISTEALPMQYAAAHGVDVRGYEEDIVFDDGTVVHAYGSASPLFDECGQVRGCIGAFMDVSELRRLERKLQQTIDELAAADRRKDEFLATLAHELRNPLAPVMNALAILDRFGSNEAMAIDARATMWRQMQQMVRLIDDLLDVSRISRGTIELRKDRVELQSLIYQATESVGPIYAAARQELAVDLPAQPVWIEADPARLAQVFANLLSNASRYSDAGRSISLRAQCVGSELVVRVKDDGIGIPPDKLESVFEMFSQLDRSLERTAGGLGIGLYIVKRLVEMHGGSVTARSEGTSKGSEFIVRLPIVAEPPSAIEPAAPIAAEATAPSIERSRILVVEDNNDAARTMVSLLRAYGYVALAAHDGIEAVEAAEQFGPHVILMDIGLPKLNGYEACQRIRSQPWGREMIVVALTGWGQEGDKRRADECGFDAHLVKPVEPARLNELLRTLLNERGRQDAVLTLEERS